MIFCFSVFFRVGCWPIMYAVYILSILFNLSVQAQEGVLTFREQGASAHISLHGISINSDTLEVFAGKDKISMYEVDAKTLLVLMKEPGRVFSRREIIDRIYEKESAAKKERISPYVVNDSIKNIRKKLPSIRHLVETEIGIRYRLREEVVSVEHLSSEAIYYPEGNIHIDRINHRVFENGVLARLKKREFDTVFYFIQNKGKLLSIDDIGKATGNFNVSSTLAELKKKTTFVCRKYQKRSERKVSLVQ